MLLSIDSISEIGRFALLRHKAPQLSRLALLFARNAYGKSTICGVLNAASNGDVQSMSSRRRLGASAESKVSTSWSRSRTVAFDGGRWNCSPGPVYVFDQDFVERNVHVAGNVTRDNKRELFSVVIGQRGIELANEIELVDTQIKAASNERAAAERAIRLAQPIVQRVADYCEMETPADIEQQVSAAAKDLELAKRASEISSRAVPRQILFASITEIAECLESTVEGVSETAAQRVAEHVSSHGMSQNGERWLKFGVDHAQNGSCPFCAQDVESNALVGTFKAFFSEAYSEHTKYVDDTLDYVKTLLPDDGQYFRDQFARNQADAEFWEKVCDLPQLVHPTEAERAEIVDRLRPLRELLKEKADAPVRPISLSAFREPADRAMARLEVYNLQVEACRPVVEAARSEAAKSDLRLATAALDRQKALQAKIADTALKDEVHRFLSASRQATALGYRKAQLQQELRDYVTATVRGRQAEINALLRAFGTNFEIEDAKASFVGREASTEYAVTIGRHSVKVGESRPGAPSFKTVLSSGDKFTLALAFFLAQVGADPQLADAVVVLDDPFSSQDMQRQFETASQIRSLSACAGQVIVMSHDPRFLHLVEKDADEAVCATFQIVFEDDARAAIKTWSALEELKAVYIRQAERIRHFANTGQFLKNGDAEGLIKDIRPFLEEYIKQRFPGRFAMLAMLPRMIEDIEAAGSDDPLHSQVSQLKALNEYTRGDMHGGASVPDPVQLRAQCRRVTDIVGHY